MVHTCRVERLADLFGTGGAHGAVGFVEGEAGLLERQPAIVEQRADFRLGIVDHPLVDHAVHAAGQHGVEMGHQST